MMKMMRLMMVAAVISLKIKRKRRTINTLFSSINSSIMRTKEGKL